jgi:hypothetical protein
VGHTSLPGLLTSATVTVVLTLPRKSLSFYFMLVCDLTIDSYGLVRLNLSAWLISHDTVFFSHNRSATNTFQLSLHKNGWLRKRRPVRRTVYIPYQWQIDDCLFNFWHCRKLWLCQPVLLLLFPFPFSYFIFVIQAAYLWVCLVGLGEPITRQFVTDSQLVKRKKSRPKFLS